MKKYKIVLETDEFNATKRYFVKRRFLLFFWDYFGEDVGAVQVRCRRFSTRKSAQEYIDELMLL